MREPTNTNTNTTASPGRQDPAAGNVEVDAAPLTWQGILRRQGRQGRQVWACGHRDHDTVAQARACAERERWMAGSSELGLRRRELRRAAGLTIQQVADALECSESKISRLENGQTGVAPRDVRDTLALDGVAGAARDGLIEVAREIRRRGARATPPDRGPRRSGR